MPADETTPTPNVHLDERERRLTVRALDVVVGRREQIEKRQGAAQTMRASELAAHREETSTLKQLADRLDAMTETK